jgi:hypothetical protein
MTGLIEHPSTAPFVAIVMMRSVMAARLWRDGCPVALPGCYILVSTQTSTSPGCLAATALHYNAQDEPRPITTGSAPLSQRALPAGSTRFGALLVGRELTYN